MTVTFTLQLNDNNVTKFFINNKFFEFIKSIINIYFLLTKPLYIKRFKSLNIPDNNKRLITNDGTFEPFKKLVI